MNEASNDCSWTVPEKVLIMKPARKSTNEDWWRVQMVYHNLLSEVSESIRKCDPHSEQNKTQETHTHSHTHKQTDTLRDRQWSEFQINFTIIHAHIISQNIMFSLCTNLELFSNYFLMSAKRRCCCCNPHPFPPSAPPPAGTCAAAAVALWKEISWQMAKSEIDFNDAPPTPTPSSYRQLLHIEHDERERTSCS